MVLGALDAVEECSKDVSRCGEAAVSEEEDSDEVMVLKVRTGQLLEELLKRGCCYLLGTEKTFIMKVKDCFDYCDKLWCVYLETNADLWTCVYSIECSVIIHVRLVFQS